MAWNPAIPATNAPLVSAPVRENFQALDTVVMAQIAALAGGQVLIKSSGVIDGVPVGINGQVLTLETGVPLWRPVPIDPGFANPMTAGGDLIVGGSGGTPTRLGMGAANAVLTVSGGTLTWAPPVGFPNPMTALGDLLRGGPAGDPTRLAPGSNGQYLTLAGGVPGWASLPIDPGFANPLTTVGDVLVGGVAGAPTRLGIGTTGQVLSVVGGTPAWAAVMANPMTTVGDLVMAASGGTPARLAIGANTQVLTVVAGVPTWQTPASGGMTNPMTNAGDLIVGGALGAANRLAVGPNTQVLTMVAGVPTWAAPTSGGMTNPMTTPGDLIRGGTAGAPTRISQVSGSEADVLTMRSGVPTWWAPAFANPMNSVGDIVVGQSFGEPARLAIGTVGQVLTVVATGGPTPGWTTLPAGLANPMTTIGDLIVGTTAGAPARLAAGTTGYVLTVVGGAPAWAASAGLGNPMTTAGDLIVGGASGAPARLAAGTNGHLLQLAGGTPTWQAPATVATVTATTLARAFPGGASDTDKVTVTRYPEIDNLATLSIGMWVYRTGTGGATSGRLLGKAGGFYCLTDGTPRYYFQAERWSGTSGVWQVATTGPSWHHILWTYSYSALGNVPTVYIDGQPTTILASTAPTGTATDSDSANNVVIGNDPVTLRCWAGRLAHVAIWNRILTADEARYLAALSPATPQYGGTLATGLVLHLPLDGTSSPEPNTVKPANPGVVTGTTSAAAPPLFMPVGLSSGYQNPMTTIGDLIVGSTAGQPSRFAAVATGAVLASAGVGTTPVWTKQPVLEDTSGSIGLFPQTPGGVVARLNATGGDQIDWFSAGTGGMYTYPAGSWGFYDVTYSVPMMVFEAGTGALYLRIYGAVKALSSGAADSAGAGYRQLRVPN